MLADGRRIPYQKLLIATGARATASGAAGCGARVDAAGTFMNRWPCAPPARPDGRVAIIGGGFIGLELAASASQRGCQVTVIEAQPRILMRGVTEAIAGHIADRHDAAGVTLLTGTGVARIEADAVDLADGRRIPADIVIAGIGAAPAIALAEAAGLALDNGIACDAEMRTERSRYFRGRRLLFLSARALWRSARCGFEAWRAAQDQAAVAAENMLGGHRQFLAVPWFWSDQYELNLQIAGLPSEGVTSCIRPLKDGAFIEFHLDATAAWSALAASAAAMRIARDIKLAEMLIAKGAEPDPAALPIRMSRYAGC